MLTIIANAGKAVMNFGYALLFGHETAGIAIIRNLITIVVMLLICYEIYRIYNKFGKRGIGFIEGLKIWYRDYILHCIYLATMRSAIYTVATAGVAWAAY